jgi:hypothetical protein
MAVTATGMPESPRWLATWGRGHIYLSKVEAKLTSGTHMEVIGI